MVTCNGMNFHYLDWGNEGAPVMLLLHGLRGHCHSWDDVAARFCGDYRVLALDQRGRGETDWAPRWRLFHRRFRGRPGRVLLHAGHREIHPHRPLHGRAQQHGLRRPEHQICWKSWLSWTSGRRLIRSGRRASRARSWKCPRSSIQLRGCFPERERTEPFRFGIGHAAQADLPDKGTVQR